MKYYLKEEDSFDIFLEKNKDIRIKKNSFSKKIEMFKYLLSCEALENINGLLNISLLFKRLTNIDSSFFNNDRIYFDSLYELIDIKLHLQKEINEVQRKLFIYYNNLIKSYNVSNEEESLHLNNFYYNLFHLLNLSDLSNIVAKIFNENFVLTDEEKKIANKTICNGKYLVNKIVGMYNV